MKNNGFYPKKRLLTAHLFKILIFILFFIVVLGFINYFYLAKCNDIFTGDQIAHLNDSISYYKLGLPVFSMTRGYALYWLSGLLYKFFPANQYTAILTNLIFAFILFSSVYAIVFKITHKNLASIFAVLLIFLYPIVFGLSRFYLFEFSLLSIVTLFICLLIYSDNFKNRAYTIFAAIVFGLGPLTKESFWLYVFAPLGYQVALLIKQRLIKKRIINIIIFFCVAAFSAFWFLSHPNEIIYSGWLRITHHGGNNPQIALFSFKNFIFYLYTLIDFNLSPVFFILFIFSLIPLSKCVFREKKLLFVWIISAYIVFSFFPWKLGRYLAAIVPGIAAITAIGLSSLKVRFRNVIYMVFLAFGIVQFIALTYDVPYIKSNYFIETNLLSKVFSMNSSNYRADFWITPPNKYTTNGAQILKSLKTYESKLKEKRRQLLICRILNRRRERDEYYDRYNSYVENPVSSSLVFLNQAENYNYKIEDCFINEDGNLEMYGCSVLRDIEEFDIVILFEPDALKYIKHKFVSAQQLKWAPPQDSLTVYINPKKVNF